MKINEDSWHYKILGCFEAPPSYNVCGYFWQVVWAIARMAFYMGLIGLFIGAFIRVLIIPLFKAEGLEHSIASMIVWIFIAGAVGYFVRRWGKRLDDLVTPLTRVERVLYYKIWVYGDYKYKRLNLLVEYLSAKKRKYCPKIEFVRDRDDA